MNRKHCWQSPSCQTMPWWACYFPLSFTEFNSRVQTYLNVWSIYLFITFWFHIELRSLTKACTWLIKQVNVKNEYVRNDLVMKQTNKQTKLTEADWRIYASMLRLIREKIHYPFGSPQHLKSICLYEAKWLPTPIWHARIKFHEWIVLSTTGLVYYWNNRKILAKWWMEETKGLEVAVN